MKVKPILTLLTAGVVGMTAYQYRLLRQWVQLPTVKRQAGDHQPPHLSVIVPARNEEANIERCALSLLEQDYPRDRYELLVLDDKSSDTTPAILSRLAARYPHLRVLQGSPLPPGWTGKSNALWTAQARADAASEWLIFIDADTEAQPHALTSAVSYAQQHELDLLSLHPCQRLGSFWEKVVQPVVFLSIIFDRPLGRVNDDDDELAAANGQFLMVRRSSYDDLGGHAAVKGRIIEDYALAELFKGSGCKVRLLVGFDIIATRMYTGLGSLFEGWSKNFFVALGSPLNGAAAAVAIFADTVLPFALLLGGLAGVALRRSSDTARAILLAGAVQSGSILLLRAYGNRAIKLAPAWGLTHPLGGLIVLAILGNSMYRILSGKGVTWKARSYNENSGTV